ADRNRSHWSTSKTPSYTKSVSWQHHLEAREFLETGDEAARLAGNAPFIIDKDSGEIHSLGTAKPLEEYLQDYEIKKATFGLP
ncbi:YrhB domain-containing protein, partial [Escherichia coli]|nr:YrhB domain-containing protein [Escherichia coli]MDA6145439.1 YrhB domain-containing protein [Escherichia coli]MDA6593118.1 YrhB domain-containing protein [Escherichia coli]